MKKLTAGMLMPMKVVASASATGYGDVIMVPTVRRAGHTFVVTSFTGDQPRDASGRFAPGMTSATSLDLDADEGVPHHIPLPDSVMDFVKDLEAGGMRALLVGGSVRDSLRGGTPHDLDFEIYHGSMDQIAGVARHQGRVDAVGAQFGVLKVRLPGRIDLDLSVPRRDNRVGVGHQGFQMEFDQGMSVREACSRRDFTINAMAYDPATRRLIDPFDGASDIRSGTLRHVGEAFDEDPLRVLRGVQMAARFDMRFDPGTARRARGLVQHMGTISSERVAGEWKKFYSGATRPSAGLAALADTGWDANFAGLAGVNDADLRAAVDRTGGDPRVLAAVIASRMSEKDARSFAHATVVGSKESSSVSNLSRMQPLPTTASQARAMARGSGSMAQRIAVARAWGQDTTLAQDVSSSVMHRPEEPWIDGHDVMAAGVPAGVGVGKALAKARYEQDARVYSNREELLKSLRQEHVAPGWA